MKKEVCEVCGKTAEMDLTMPLPIGIFKADTCIKCGLEINGRIDLVNLILMKRGKLMGIKLPMNMKTANKVCGTKIADIKVK